MESEVLFIVILIMPWIVVLAALFFYRQRRLRKMTRGFGNDRKQGGPGA